MNHFRKILKYAKPYKRFAWLNVLFNILYAIFNVLSVLAFIPVLNILFSTEKKVIIKPIYEGITSIGSYLENSFNYFSNYV